MNAYEARMKVARTIEEVLVDLGTDEDDTPDVIEELRDSMADAVEIILEALDLDVVEVQPDGTVLVAVKFAEE